jgi:hypothetical protein
MQISCQSCKQGNLNVSIGTFRIEGQLFLPVFVSHTYYKVSSISRSYIIHYTTAALYNTSSVRTTVFDSKQAG